MKIGLFWAFYSNIARALAKKNELMKVYFFLHEYLYKVIIKIIRRSGDWSSLSFSDGLHQPSLQRNPVKRSFECLGSCYHWHEAPFNVPLDGHHKILSGKQLGRGSNVWSWFQVLFNFLHLENSSSLKNSYKECCRFLSKM